MNGSELTALMTNNGLTHQHGTFWNRIDNDSVIAITIFGNDEAHVVVRHEGEETTNERCSYERAAECVELYV